VAHLTIGARDDGGGTDTSAPASAAITITPTAPSILAGPTAVLEADGIHADLAVVAGPAAHAAELSYRWEAVAAPKSIAVAFADDAAAQVVAAIPAAGAYTFRVTVSDRFGRSVSGDVPLAVAAVASSLAVTPGSVHLAVGESCAFSATVFDQFGHALDAAPAAAWSVDGGGTIDAAGTLTAPTLGAPFAVVATVGSLSATAALGVYPLFDAALHQAATQSTTYPFADGPAWHAVDGNTDGNFWDGSVTHTSLELHAHWDVDLGASFAVRQLLLWNRTDQLMDRLSDYWVFLSDQPFASDDPDVESQTAGVTVFRRQENAGAPTTFTMSVSARYVRVQLAGTNYLSIAEVQVMALDDGTLRAVGALAPQAPGATAGDDMKALGARRPRLRAA
jgi:hypothetical protein